MRLLNSSELKSSLQQEEVKITAEERKSARKYIERKEYITHGTQRY